MGTKEKESFIKNNKEIAKCPTLMSPYFCKDFRIHPFSSEICFAVVLTKKNDEGNKFMVSFMSYGIQGK